MQVRVRCRRECVGAGGLNMGATGVNMGATGVNMGGASVLAGGACDGGQHRGSCAPHNGAPSAIKQQWA